MVSRQYFVEKNFDALATPLHWRQPLTIRSLADLKAFLETVALGIRLSLMLDVSDVPLLPIWKFLVYRLSLRLEPAAKVFIFDYDHLETFLLARYLGIQSVTQTYYLPSNSSLFEAGRYGAYSGIEFVSCSTAQLEELESFQAIGWMKFEDVRPVLAGSLFAHELDKMSREQRYDVAFYSSGEWARRGGLWRVSDPHGIRAGLYQGSEYDLVARKTIETLAALARTERIRFVVHLHPYERQLATLHGIDPPFMHYLDGEYGRLGPSHGSEHSNLFDAQVGVVTISSCFYDRLALGLPTLVYAPPAGARRPSQAYYRVEHTPAIAEWVFRSMGELSNKVLSALEASAK